MIFKMIHRLKSLPRTVFRSAFRGCAAEDDRVKTICVLVFGIGKKLNYANEKNIKDLY